MAKRKMIKGPAMIYKTLHRKLKIEERLPHNIVHNKLELNF